MSIDEPRNWSHAEALERGESPAGDRLPEYKAAERLAAAIGTHLSPQWLTNACLEDVCKKIVAHRGFFRSVFDELDADPKRIVDRGAELRQQSYAHFDDLDWIGELVHHLRRELADAEATYERVRTAAQPQLVDRDEREADEDDSRISVERADEKAAQDAPRVAS